MDPNVIGYVVEFVEERDVSLNEAGNNLVANSPKIRLKLHLRNTLGKDRILWVDGPNDLADFFSST